MAESWLFDPAIVGALRIAGSKESIPSLTTLTTVDRNPELLDVDRAGVCRSALADRRVQRVGRAGRIDHGRFRDF
jgi:hypothetical protein